MITRHFHLHALSALHVGTGQATGIVDLPIARARATQLPIVPGSAIKGVLRDDFLSDDKEADADANKKRRATLKLLFGPESTDDTLHAGALTIGDAHLLALPVRSLVGIMAYATCPFILRQYARDLELKLKLPANAALAHTCDTTLHYEDKVWIDDFDFAANLSAEAQAETTAWAKQIAEAVFPGDENAQKFFVAHFLILPDDSFAFLAENATEIRARIRMKDDTRTVDDGALWYEENLPAETILWGTLGITRSRHPSETKSNSEMEEALTKHIKTPHLLQIGGKATVGRGLCRLLLRPKPAEAAKEGAK